MAPALREGLNAYAFRQAEVFMSLHNHFLSLWQGLTASSGTPDDHLTLVPMRTEEAMEGVDGGDADME